MFAFTLSEVLVTLFIIGIVATMTIPNLIQEQQEKQTVVKLQKAYSTLSSAYTLAVQENGTPDYWELGDMNNVQGVKNLNTIMVKHLNVQKNCGIGGGCFPALKYKDLNGVEVAYVYNSNGALTKLILADGTLLLMGQWSGDCSWDFGLKNVCGYMGVDVNGFKGPNKLGVDYFGFIFTKNRIVPNGSASQASYTFANYCNLSKASTADYANGGSCTAWVIYNGNMDYLHCNDLSWTGKHTCN